MAKKINTEEILQQLEKYKDNSEYILKEYTKVQNNIFPDSQLDRIKEKFQKVSEDVLKETKKIQESIQSFDIKIDINEPIKTLDKFNKKINDIQENLKNTTNEDEIKKYNKQLQLLFNASRNFSNTSSKYYREVTSLQKELNKRQIEGITILDDYNEKWEQRTKAVRRGFNEIKTGTQQAFNAIKGMLEPWSKAQAEALSYARTMGMSQKTADAYLKKTTDWASKNQIGILFNKTTDELIKMQSKFSETIGRNVQLTGEQKKNMLAMEKFLGEDGMIDMANNLENFGLGLSDSAEFVKKTLDDATKSGISASKLTKTIRENIKMAQNYTFKNGLEGLKSMAKKAIELKTDMSLINSLAEKTSTVEGAITTGANLQVLGGAYAMGSDPLSMMYESLNDIEGLFDRATNMAKGKVFYNEQSGNFEMGAMDRYLMKQAATAMGIDPSKMIDAAYRQASLGKIESQAKLNSNISDDEDMMSLVKNLATWDKGEAVIDINGKRTRVSDLQASDKEVLETMQKTDSQNLQDMAISLRGIKDMMDGTIKEKQNEQAELMSGIGQGLTDFMRSNTGLLDSIAKIGAWGATLSDIATGVYGIWTTMIATARLGRGVGNLFSGKPNSRGMVATGTGKITGKGIGAGTGINTANLAGSTITAKGSGQTYKINKNGTATNLLTGKTINKGAVTNMVSHGATVKPSMLKTVGKFGGRALGGAALAGGISLASDMISGDYAKDKEKSWIDAGGAAAGAAAGAAIGSIIPGVGTLIGGAIGGLIGGLGADAITGAQKSDRAKEREKIAGNNPNLAHFFIGENALVGNYSIKDLNAIKDALSDNKISQGELSQSLMDKISANDDIARLKNNGATITAAYGSGGFVQGNSHENGGVNIEAEGGEYIINKKATQENLPVLEGINKGDLKMVAKEPLGKQMKVAEGMSNINTGVTNTKVEIPPVSINLSGTIKLDTGNKQVDITNELIKNPILINKLTDMISKQLNILDNGAYNKGKFKQKFS